MRSMVVVAVLCAMSVSALADDLVDNFRFIRGETREASRRDTLAQYMPEMTLGSWHVIGPFDNSGMNKHHVEYPPELEIDLAATYPDKRGKAAGWEVVEDDGWMRIDFKRYGTEEDNTDGIGYAWRIFESDAEAEVEFEMGSDDGLRLWFNDDLVVDADVYRGMNIQDHVLKLTVRKGRNTILAKVTQGVGGWEFQMRPRLDPRVAALVAYYLEKEFPQSPESTYYRLLSVLEPDGVVLEVGGLDVLPDGRPIVTTRRGEAWLIEDAYDDPPFACEFKLFAFGLHEPLGAAWRDNGLYVVQRGELSHLVDTDGDERADVFRTVSDAWGLSGNYHEFAFGPKFDNDGRMWVTLNLGFCGSLGKSIVPWRGWAMIVEDDASLTPVCGGLRSPNGIGKWSDGAMFYADNQGDWVGTSKLSHLDFGDWHGHPGGDGWYEEAGMTPPRGEQDFKQPAIWFPYDRMGRSTSEPVLDETGGAFGPFTGQFFVGDQYGASIMRVDLEKIEGVYQGACFPFRTGLDCGVNRLAFGTDGSLFAGLTNRGWWSFGNRPWGLQRIVYTGVEPFEIQHMRVRPGGFELTFTGEPDATLAADASRYRMASFTHHRWAKYGSPEIERRELPVSRVRVDGRRVLLDVPGLRETFVHELLIDGLTAADGRALLHPEAYYTLNVIPK